MSEKDNGKIMVQEKREIANLVTQQFNEVIGDIKQQETASAAEITQKIAKKLGLAMLQKEIKMYESKIDTLKAGIKKLGLEVSSYGDAASLSEEWIDGEHRISPKTPAGKLYYEIARRKPEIKKLEKKKANVLKEIWLSDTKKQVRKLTSDVIGKITFIKPAAMLEKK